MSQKILKTFIVVAFVGITGVAFAISFTALSDLAARSGIPLGIAWGWPLIVDCATVAAILVVFTNRGKAGRGNVMPWVVIVFCAVVSVVSNAVHTVIVFDPAGGVNVWFAVFIGAVPPIMLIFSSEMLVRLAPAPQPAETGQVAPLPESVKAPVSKGAEPYTAQVTARVAAPVTEQGSAPVAEQVKPAESPAPVRQETSAQPKGAQVTESLQKPGSGQVFQGRVGNVVPFGRRPEIPSDPDGQVAWIQKRISAGEDVSKERVLELFEGAGIEISMRTVQRRIQAARETVPEAGVRRVV